MKLFRRRYGATAAGISLLLLIAGCSALAQSKRAPVKSGATAAEQRAELGLDAAKSSPLALRVWLRNMPKGGDLHNHIFGAIYAETWIKDAVDDHMCIDRATLTLTKSLPDSTCVKNEVPAAEADRDQHLYDALVDAFSMRSFVPATGNSGHDHFFDSFAKFGNNMDLRHLGEWLDELAVRGAAQNEQYLELMHTPPFGHAAAAARAVGWQDNFAKLRDELLAHGLREDIAATRAGLDAAEADRGSRERCAQSDAAPVCKVQIRYLYQVLRGFPKEDVFAQTLLGLETASIDPRFVGINFVMPEDGYVSMTDYALQMRMLQYLHSVYPKIHITLHAGEIAPGLVPYDGLCCHIRLAIDEGHAERIGHGVDVMYETHPHELLREMAAKHVMVEINLTSNDVILGVAGKNHPFETYRQFHVPVALSTDDEGVSRIDMTHEFVRAVETYNLHYADLKQLVRTSLEHSFLPGPSLWMELDNFHAAVNACANESLGSESPKKPCADFLSSSERAQQQWELERRFQQFESQF
jgi:adenosine deaminase